MKTTVLGALLLLAVTALAFFGSGHPNEALAERVAAGAADARELIAIPAMVSDKVQQLTVIDPHSRVMSVYHINLPDGAVTLKSVRTIHWDLQMTEFNGVDPRPQEIKAMLEAR